MSYTISREIPKSSVTVEKWLHRNELRMGMYVAELDKPWEQTDFMFQGFRLNNKMANTPLNSHNRMCGVNGSEKKTLWNRAAR